MWTLWWESPSPRRGWYCIPVIPVTWETGAGVQDSMGLTKNFSKGINKEKGGREGRTGRGKEKLQGTMALSGCAQYKNN